jgi:hypothetical protein
MQKQWGTLSAGLVAFTKEVKFFQAGFDLCITSPYGSQFTLLLAKGDVLG